MIAFSLLRSPPCSPVVTSIPRRELDFPRRELDFDSESSGFNRCRRANRGNGIHRTGNPIAFTRGPNNRQQAARLRQNGRLSGRNHFPSSAKSPGNKPVLALPNQRVRSCWPSFSTRFTASSFGPPFPASLGREESYDRGRRGSGCHFQHQHLRGSCFRCVSDTLMGIFMDRSTFPAADPSRRSHHLPRAALGADHRLAALRRLFQ